MLRRHREELNGGCGKVRCSTSLAESDFERIRVAACPETVDLVIEIGPGRGRYSKLLNRRQRWSNEVDYGSLSTAAEVRPALEVIHSDVSDRSRQWGRRPIAGICPTTSHRRSSEKTLAHRHATGVFLIQKEVAIESWEARHSRLRYDGADRALRRTALAFSVKPGAFRPAPSDSAVVRWKSSAARPEKQCGSAKSAVCTVSTVSRECRARHDSIRDLFLYQNTPWRVGAQRFLEDGDAM